MTSQHNAVAPTSGDKILQTNNFANMPANRVDCRNLPGMERGIPETSGATNYGVINNYGPVTISLHQCGQNGHRDVRSGAVVPFYGNFDGHVYYPTVSSQQNAQQIKNRGPYLNAPNKKVQELKNGKFQRLNDYR